MQNAVAQPIKMLRVFQQFLEAFDASLNARSGSGMPPTSVVAHAEHKKLPPFSVCGSTTLRGTAG